MSIDPGVKLRLSGKLTLASVVVIEGKFTLDVTPNKLEITMVARLSIAQIGGLDATGGLRIDGNGIVLYANLSMNASFGGDIGLRFSAAAHLEFNTNGATQTLNIDGVDYQVRTGLLLRISGSVEFLGFATANGFVEFSISPTETRLLFGVNFSLGGLTFAANGGAEVAYGNDPGMALFLNVSVEADAEVFRIEASGSISINTTGTTRLGIAAHSFYLALNGEVSILEVLNFDAGFSIIVRNGGWRFDFHADIDVFGILTLTGSGFLDSNGNFDITVSGALNLGGGGFGLFGSATFHIWNTTTLSTSGNPIYSFGLSISAELSVKAFGITIAGVRFNASFTANNVDTPRVEVKLSVTVGVTILFVSFDVTVEFSLGYLQLPPPVFLGSDFNGPDRDCFTDPGASSPDDGGNGSLCNQNAAWPTPDVSSTLYLNVGDRASYRNIGLSPTVINEEFYITDGGYDDAGRRLTKISAFGRSNLFANVNKIVARFGNGNDKLFIDPSIADRVEFDVQMGSGDDYVVYGGSNACSTFSGDDGIDSIYFTGIVTTQCGGDLTVTINGGIGSDYIDASAGSGALVHGNGDADFIAGSPYADALYGDDGDDEIAGNGGADLIDGGAGTDKVSLTFNGLGSKVTGGAHGVQGDFLVLSATSQSDIVRMSTISENGYTFRILSIGSSAPGSHTIDVVGVETVTLFASGGPDLLTVDDLGQSGVQTLRLDLGGDDGAADRVELYGSDTNDTFTLAADGPNFDTRSYDGVRVSAQTGNAPYAVAVTGSNRSHGDVLRIETGVDRLPSESIGVGNDRVDASGLGAEQTAKVGGVDVLVRGADRLALQILTGQGDDVLIGSPFNDLLDGGTGSDRYTGGDGLDTFFDASPVGDVDVLIETFDRDMGLFDDTFVVGNVLADDGTAFGLRDPWTQQQLEEEFKVDDPNLRFPSKADRWSGLSIVEDLKFIFEQAELRGGSGRNVLVVGDADGQIRVGGATRLVAAWTGRASLDNADNTENAFPEYYVINVVGNHASRISVRDSGGNDMLLVFGTDGSDWIGLNAAGAGAARTGFITVGRVAADGTDVRDSVLYRGVELVQIDLLGGPDTVVSDDTATMTLINLGGGDDEIVIGTVPLIADPGNRTLEFPDGVPVVDTANMTNGNSAPLFVLGEGNNDRFEVNHNRAKLFLHGGSGNDRFLLKTFLVLRENPDDAEQVTNLASLFGGTGTNRYDYLQNGPVFINGGPGIDTIVVVGTPIGDTFIVTDVSIVGAGRIVTFTNIESVEVDGAGGPDTLWVLSTAAGMSTTLIGGGGDDTIHIGGTPPPLIIDPPSYTYTPPPLEVELPPVIVYENVVAFNGAYATTINSADFLGILSLFGVDPDPVRDAKLRALDVAVRAVLGVLNAAKAQVPYYRFPSIKIGATGSAVELLNPDGSIRTPVQLGGSLETVLANITVQSRVAFSFLGLLNVRTSDVTVNNLTATFEAGRTVAVTKLVQAQPITIDPPVFVYVAPSQYDLTKIRGPLTVIGGESAEGLGDLLVVHNQQGSSAPSLLVNRVAPRRIQVGEDQAGNPIYVQETDTSTGVALFDTFMSLEGMGLTTGVGADGVPFYGVELFGFERVDLRLSDNASGDHLTVALNQYRGVASVDQVLRPAQIPADAPELESMQIQIVAGGGDDVIDLLHYRGQVAVLGGAGNDTVNVGDRNLLSGVLGTLIYDGDAHIREIQRQAVLGDFPATVLANLPSVFVDTLADKTLVDRGGNFFAFTDPTMASVVFTGVDGKLWIHAVVLADSPVQEFGVHERGVQKTDGATPLWLGLDGNETIDAAATGIPVIVRSTAPSAQFVYLTSTGTRVFTCPAGQTCVASIVAAVSGETALPVFRDAAGRKTLDPGTLANPNRPSYRILRGDLIEDLVQLKGTTVTGVQEYGVQATDPNTSAPLWLDLDGTATTDATKTGIPVINTVAKTVLGAQLVYLNEDGLRVFAVTSIPSIVASNGGDLATTIFVDVAGNRYLSGGSGRKPVFTPNFSGGSLLYLDTNGLLTATLDALVNGGADASADLVVYLKGGTCGALSVTGAGATFASAAAVAIVGDENFVGTKCGYAVTGSASAITISGSAGTLVDAVGIVAGSRGSSGIAFPSIVLVGSVTNASRVVALGVPDNVSWNLGSGSLTFQSFAPALVPVNRSAPVPFMRTVDVYEFFTGIDHLNVLGGATTGPVTGTLDRTSIPQPALTAVTDGLDLQYHDGTITNRFDNVTGPVTLSRAPVDAAHLVVVRLDGTPVVLSPSSYTLVGTTLTLTGLPSTADILVVFAAEKQFYLGGEQVYEVRLIVNERGEQDAILVPVLYLGGELVFDVVTGLPVYDWDGTQRRHAAGDPVLHVRGEAVVHYAAEIRRYLGGRLDLDLDPTGEPILDEQGDVVVNGDGSVFVAAAGQGQIHNARDLAFDAVLYRTATAVNPVNVTIQLVNFARSGTGALFIWNAVGASATQFTFDLDDDVVAVIARSARGSFVVRPGDVSVERSGGRMTGRVTINLTGSYLVGSQTLTVAELGDVWFELSTKIQAFQQAGDQQRWFGDEPVANGQPVVDSSGNLVLAQSATGAVVVLWTDNATDPGIAAGTKRYIRDAQGRQLYHRRGEPKYVTDAAADLGFSPLLFVGGEDKLRIGSEARRYFGGEQAFYSAAEIVRTGTQTSNPSATGKDAAAYRIELRGALGGAIYYRNLDDVVVVTGRGDDRIEIRATHVGETVLDTGAGNDRVDVFSTSGNTTVLAGAGTNDVVRVGGLTFTSPAVVVPGVHLLDTIDSILVVSGAETLIADDKADATGDVTVVGPTSITGADMGPEEEVQQITIDADAGQFQLDFGGATTGPIGIVTFGDGSHSELPTADTVRQALEALATIDVGDVQVTLDVRTYTIRFRNNLAGVDVAQLQIVNSTLTKVGVVMDLTGRVQTIRNGADGAAPFGWNEHQIVSVLSTFRLWFRGSTVHPVDETTSALSPTASAADVEAALLALNGLEFGDVSVTKLRDGVFGIDFRRQYAGQQMVLLGVLDDPNGSVRTRIDGIEYWGVQHLVLDLGSGQDTVIVTGTDDETLTAAIDAHAGADLAVIETVHHNTALTMTVGAANETDLDTVVVRGTDSTVDGVDGAVMIIGGGPDYLYNGANRDRLFVYDEGETSDNSGALSRTRTPIDVVALTGFDMDLGITYAGFERFELYLGQRDDTFQINGTHDGYTLVNAGPRLDRVDIEATMGETRIEGDGGNDTINVNLRPTVPTFGDQIGDTLDDNVSTDDVSGGDGTSGDDTLTLDGQAGSDTYVIRMVGSGSSLINVFDSGSPTAGTDTLTINGTPDADRFLMRASKTGARIAFVALLNDGQYGGFGLYERVNYDENIDGGLTVNGLEGDDTFTVDDNAARTTLNGGIGDDTFQFGQVYETRRDGAAGVHADDYFATLETTRGFLSNGVTVDLTANGGSGEDLFVVFHNLATLNLNGGFGDDTFIVKAFALVGSQDNLRERDSVDISGDDGADLIQYAVNAPVNINGGEGFDTVIVVGTEFGDDFVITETGVFGAGLNVNYVAVEKLTVDGAEGDDRFYVLGTGPGLTTELLGGLGSDAIFVGGDANPVVTNDLLGHSGLIEHVVTLTSGSDPTFLGVEVEGLHANVADNDEPFVKVIQSAGDTHVVEGQTVAGLDSYQLVLTSRPDRVVIITVAVDQLSPEDEARGARTVTLSTTAFQFRTIAALDDAGNTVTISLAGGVAPFANGDRVMYDRRGTGGSIGGLTDGRTYIVSVISTVPGVSQVVQLKAAENDPPIDLSGGLGSASHLLVPAAAQIQLVFTPDNWWQPQTVYLAALDDTSAEGQHFTSISHSVLSRNIATASVAADASTGTTTLVIPVAVLLDGAPGTLAGRDLRGVRLEIVTAGGVVRTSILAATLVGSQLVLTVSDPWRAAATPKLGDVFRITLDDAVRGLPAIVVTNSITAGNTNLGVLGDIEIGVQLIASGYVSFDAGATLNKIVWATSDTLVLANPVTITAGAHFSIRDSSGTPMFGGAFLDVLVTGVSSATFTDPGAFAGLDLTGLTIEIIDGTGIGQKRTIVAHDANSVTVGRPWTVTPDGTSVYQIRRYDSLPVRSVAVAIDDDDAAGVAVLVTNNGTRVAEWTPGCAGCPATPPAWTTNSYQLVLTRQPTSAVTIVISSADNQLRFNGQTTLTLTFTAVTWNVPVTIIVTAVDDAVIEGPRVEVIDHTVSAGDIGVPVANTDVIVAEFDVSSVMLSERPISGAPITFVPAGAGLFTLTVGSGVVGGSYFLTVGGERTRRIPFNASAATVYARLRELVSVPATLTVSGGGGVFTIGLPSGTPVSADGSPLIAGVTVTVDGVAVPSTEFVVDDSVLTFRSSASGEAVYRSGVIRVTYSYLKSGFLGAVTPTIDVRIDDNEVIPGRNDAPSVLVLESDGSTDVAEWSACTGCPATAPDWTSDTYQIVLTRAPAAGATVRVSTIAIATRTSTGEVFYTFVQLTVDGLGYVEFTSTNWWIPQTVTVRAAADTRVDGGDTQVFAHRFDLVTGVRGPLIVDGAGGNGSLGIPAPVLLPRETDQKPADGTVTGVSADGLTITLDFAPGRHDPLIELVGRTVEMLDADSRPLFRQIRQVISVTALPGGGTRIVVRINRSFQADLLNTAQFRGFVITHESNNFFVDENEQVDSLTVFNGDSVASDAMTLSATRITGLGMGPDRTIGGRRQPGGITYTGLEELDIRLGQGADTVTVDSTHAGLTRIDLGDGYRDGLTDGNLVYVRTTQGHLTIIGGQDSDTVILGTNSRLFGTDTVNEIRGLVSFDGGAGSDRLVLNDDQELADNVVTVAKHTINGLDMAPVNEVQTITVRASAGTFRLTYGGQTTGALAYDASASDVQSALEALAGIGAGNVRVDKIGVAGSGVGSIFVVRFRGRLTGSNVAQIAVDGGSLAAPVLGTGSIPAAGATATAEAATRTEGTATRTTNEVQIVEIDASIGSFTLVLTVPGSNGSADLSYVSGLISMANPDETSMAAAILAALQTLSPLIGNVQVQWLETVAGSRRFAVRFVGALAGSDVPLLRTGGDPGAFVWTLVEGTTDAVVDDVLTITVQGGGDFTVELAVNGVRVPGTVPTVALNRSMTADQVENALQLAILGSVFALDIVVERFETSDGTVFMVHFQGVLRDARGGSGVGFFNVVSSSGTSVRIDSLMDGIFYTNVERLDIDLGAGTDIVNVRGTTAVTSIHLDAANTSTVPMDEIEAIYVSSDADLDARLQGSLDAIGPSRFDLLSGHLDDILGRLDLDAGRGRHRLWISDEADTTGDVATITDVVPAAAPGDIQPEITITGLSPARIGFRADTQTGATGGNFAGGVTIWTGRGNDTVTIDGTHNRAAATNPSTSGRFAPDASGTPLRTVTTLNTGAGADTVYVSLSSADGFFVVNGQSGDDTIDADGAVVGGATVAASTLPIVAFGGDGSDTIWGGLGSDILFGDNGRVHHLVGTTLVARLGGGGPGDLTDGVVRDPNLVFDSIDGLVGNDGMPRDDEARDASANDRVAGNTGDDILIGGGNGTTGTEILTGDANDDIVIGDHALVRWTVGANRVGTVTRITSMDTHLGGNDTVSGNDASDIVVGGFGSDTGDGGTAHFESGDGNDVVVGDNVDINLWALTDPQYSAANGLVFRVRRIETIARTIGGADTLRGGANDDIVIGGADSDTLDGDGARDLIFGDNVMIDRTATLGSFVSLRYQNLSGSTLYTKLADGTIVANLTGLARLDPTRDSAWGDYVITLLDHDTAVQADPQNRFGNDRISGGADNDMIFGQLGNDVIEGDGTITRAVGDDGTTLTPSVEDFDGIGTDGDDSIEGGGGADVIFGGLGQDDIIGGSSDRYGLVTPAQRPDGVDRIFGGAGTRITLDDAGRTTADGHARDADTILGDNGRITRITVTAASGVRSAFQAFTYDSAAFGYSSTVKLIPRVVGLLDYSPKGEPYVSADAAETGDPSPAVTVGVNAAVTNIGGGDVIHGEGGDDTIYGMSRTDTLFGDGQDDDIYGNAGWDWISGGTGIDGILGDDGLLSTSRNGQTEVLWGVTTPNVQTNIALPGGMQSADIYVANELRKEADLVPFWIGNNDIVYGGRGNDFIHGGVGDDALSGAEALALYYDNGRDPIAVLVRIIAAMATRTDLMWTYELGDILRFNRTTGAGQTGQANEFDAYDEFNPWRKVMLYTQGGAPVVLGGGLTTNTATGHLDWLLNFASVSTVAGLIDDGKDTIFGDAGDDWIVGGTGYDRLWGGWGDDLLQADDDLNSVPDTAHLQGATPDPYANDSPDQSPSAAVSYADVAYGGAGRDVLIANTGIDRLIDWVGEFNSYVVPFAPFGAFTISRQNAPALRDWLYALSRADGADRSRGPNDSLSTDARNGEPYGEAAIVIQKDPFWQDQTGGPDDPQPGHDPGAKDIKGKETFTTAANLFVPVTGTWSVANGSYQSAATRSSDAVSVFYLDAWLPSTFEIVAKMFVDKAKAGFKSNAYVVLDYQHATDFKFAGIDTANDKVQIGRRTAAGWMVLAERPMQLLDNRTYQVTVRVEATLLRVFVDGVEVVSYLFDATLIDPTRPEIGFVDPLTDGYMGLGSVESVGGITSFTVQAPTPEITLSVTDDFAGSTNLIAGSGIWSIANGDAIGSPSAGLPAVTLTRFDVAASARLEVTTVLRSAATAGIAFDAAGPARFKFAVISAATGQVMIGHFAGGMWVVDAIATLAIDPSIDHTVRLVLTANVVTMFVDGTQALSTSYTSLLNDGDVGLLTRGGAATFRSLTIATDDPDLRGAALPTATVGDVSVVEGTGGTRTVAVTVTLSAPAATPVAIQYDTVDVTATAGSDYIATSGTLQFAAGQTSLTVLITISGDAQFEGDETFLVRLTGAAGAVIVDNTAVVTIANDDVPTTPTVSVANVVVTEGAAGATSVHLVFRLDSAASGTTSVRYATVDGTATSGSDYVGATGTVTFAAGQTVADVFLTVNGDASYEANEQFAIQLSNAVGVAIGTATVTVTITNDDAAPLVSITSADASGGEPGTDVVTFTITRSANLSGALTIGLNFGGTATYAADYVVSSISGGTWNATTRSVTLAAGVATATLTLTPVDDTAPEVSESIVVTVAAGTDYLTTSPASATATIADNDNVLPSLSVNDVSVLEGNAGQINVVVTISLSRPSTSSVSVTVRTVDGTAVNGSDYRGLTTTLTIAAGQTSATVTIRVLGDRTREGNETFSVELVSPVNAAILDGQGVVTIIDDDGAARATQIGTGGSSIDPDQIRPALIAAAAGWAVPTGLFQAIDVQIVDLPFDLLAQTSLDGRTIWIDVDAAGWGWSTDVAGPVASGRIDLVTVLAHELGHVLGLEHGDRGLAADRFAPGQRTIPDPGSVDASAELVLPSIVQTSAWFAAVARPLTATVVAGRDTAVTIRTAVAARAVSALHLGRAPDCRRARTAVRIAPGAVGSRRRAGRVVAAAVVVSGRVDAASTSRRRHSVRSETSGVRSQQLWPSWCWRHVRLTPSPERPPRPHPPRPPRPPCRRRRTARPRRAVPSNPCRHSSTSTRSSPPRSGTQSIRRPTWQASRRRWWPSHRPPSTSAVTRPRCRTTWRQGSTSWKDQGRSAARSWPPCAASDRCSVRLSPCRRRRSHAISARARWTSIRRTTSWPCWPRLATGRRSDSPPATTSTPIRS